MALPNGQAFALAVVAWHKRHGRHGLPWQGTRDPYRVWLSEVMLQQTQVATALPFYERFLQRFAHVGALAAAPQDEVLALWSGLGYYSRARNLHRCAQVVVQEHAGRFPRSAAALEQLPGIGPSTAAAIASFCFDEQAAILDGNVKRVLARVGAVQDDLSRPAAHRALLQEAVRLLPPAQLMPAYTQGVMDLGATVCLPRAPRCGECPVQALCRAKALNKQSEWPVRARRAPVRHEDWHLLWLQRAGQWWLQPRAETGIWAGLWCLPVFASEAALHMSLRHRWPKANAIATRTLAPMRHVLTHRVLMLHPHVVQLGTRPTWPNSLTRWPDEAPSMAPALVSPPAPGRWVNAEGDWPSLGLPAALSKLFASGG